MFWAQTGDKFSEMIARGSGFGASADRMSKRQTEDFHGTNGAYPRDGCNPNVDASRQIPFCFSDLGFFSSQFSWIL